MTVLQSKLVYEPGRRLGYQGPRSSTHVGPVHCDKFTRTTLTDLNILQLNVDGLQHKSTELNKVLSDNNVHIALLQETVLPKHNVSTPGYTQVLCECQKCRGVMTLIRKDVQAETTNAPVGDVDVQKTNVWLGKCQYNIFNIYCPPASLVDIPLQDTHFKNTIIAGDFNANTPSLGYSHYNKRGRELEDLCNSTNLILEQDMESPPTLLHKAHKTTGRPDLTLMSADVYDSCQVQVIDDVGSDHLPILITIKSKTKQVSKKRRTLWNFKKTNWKAYAAATDATLGHLDVTEGSEDEVCQKIIDNILKAAREHIPRGHRKRYKPFWNKELEETVKLRRKARKKAEKNPTPENKTAHNRLTAKVRLLVRKGKKDHWTNTCEQLNLNQEGHKAWKLINNLEGSSRKENQKPMTSNGKKVTNPMSKAKKINGFLSSVSKSTRRRTLDKALWKQFKSSKNAPSCNLLPFEKEFSSQELARAIKKAAKRKAPGPDGVTNEMIANLGIMAQMSLLMFINRTWKESKIPTQWRTARVTPILKKGKPAGQPSSYRPISLTSCLGKIAERMVNSRLYYWLENNKLLNNAQAGFRRKSRTEDQLFRLIQNVIDGFQEGKSTTAVFIDLQQAYDRVWRKGLLIKMSRMGVHGKMLSWIQAFLSNRTIQTTFDGTTSPKSTIEEGLPQGSSLSCTLFLIFINDLPDLINVQKALFADDLVIWTTEKYPTLAKAKLNRTLKIINLYCNFWKLKINEQKTVFTIFSRSSKTSKLPMDIRLNGKNVKKDDNPAYLGVELDRGMKLTGFMMNLKLKAAKRLNLLKRLASTTWGADKSTLRRLYLGYIRSAMDYALPLQNIAPTQARTSLDRVQNAAAKLISGGMRSTPTAACEIDANLEPLDLRRERAALESIERYRRLEEDHPNRQIADSWTSNQRLQQKSPMEVVKELEETHLLPQNRQAIHKLSDFPPWTTLQMPTICTSLIDPTVDKKSDPNVLRSISLETIDSYGEEKIVIYTDGSAFKGTVFAGYGVLMKFPDGSSSTVSSSCGDNCSNFEAEIAAIDCAIQQVKTLFDEKSYPPCDIVVFTDSKSTLESLESPHEKVSNDIICLTKTLQNLLTSYDINLYLQWIPGHSNIMGNDTADKLAKAGAQMEQPDKPTSMETASRVLKDDFHISWMTRWTQGTTGRVMFDYVTKPCKNDPINELPRKDQCLIFQFRTGHCRLNLHLNRINPVHLPSCRNCGHPYESVDHVLLYCQPLQIIRDRYLPSPPTLQNTLYADTQQLTLTSQFIHKALKSITF